MTCIPVSHLTKIVCSCREAKRVALIPFLTAGIPSPDRFWETIIELAQNGADIIEIGVPFSDPVADGPVVAAASSKALQAGTSLPSILEGLTKHKNSLGDTGIVLMGYANPFLQYGWPQQEPDARLTGLEAAIQTSLAKLAKDAATAGVHGMIIPDLPADEAHAWQKAFQQHHIDLIPLVGLNTPAERMQRYAASSKGYAYVVSVLGTTGARDAFPPELAATIRRARSSFSIPLALGFGLQHPKQLENFPNDCRPEAVVFGSALIKHLEAGGTVKDFMTPWTQEQR